MCGVQVQPEGVILIVMEGHIVIRAECLGAVTLHDDVLYDRVLDLFHGNGDHIVFVTGQAIAQYRVDIVTIYLPLRGKLVFGEVSAAV